uniref:Olfactory receptor n=1 Tax=Erpetoichthys calabaricus TaxID=27687 RepID=A0A8C4SS48_ERPCA
MENVTFSTMVFILECLDYYQQKNLITIILFFIYFLTLIGNILVIIVITLDHQLQTPMYFYIGILACIDLTCSTNIIPRMLCAVLFDQVVPRIACFVQLYTLHHLETFLLTFMAFDRYVAVVNPLRYRSIVTNKMVTLSFVVSNILSIFTVVPFLLQVNSLQFCRTNVIPYCMCDYITMVRLACVDFLSFLIPGSTVCAVLQIFPLGSIIFSYSKIVEAVLKISSKEGRKKAFSTCLTHLMVVGIFYIPFFIAYVLPSTGISAEEYNIIAIIPCIIPPMFNPIIYSFRNKEMKKGILKLICKRRVVPDPTTVNGHI